MAEELSAKRPRGETPDDTTKCDDVKFAYEKLDYTQKLETIEVQGKEPLHVPYTSNPEEANDMIKKLWMKAGGLLERIVGVDVEFTRSENPNERAAIQQLCVEDQCMVYHITAATEKPDWLDPFLKDDLYTFAGFSIQGDKRMLKNSGLENDPNKYIDIQRKWRDPYTDKDYNSLTDVTSRMIHPFYADMKKKINRKEVHELWGVCPLREKLIKYAAIDAYTTYQAWKKIITTKKGMVKAEYEEMFGNPYSYYE